MANEILQLDGNVVLPAQGLLDRFTRIDELLIANMKVMKELGGLVKVQIGPEGGYDLATQRRRAETGEWVPYSTKVFALDTARTDSLVVVEGDFLQAWTDGSYEGIGVRYNLQSNDILYFQRRNPIYGFKFWRLYLTHTAQAGKTLDLLIGREASAYAETYSITSIMENKVSAVLDSTVAALGIAGTYTGAAFGVESYARIIGSCYSDVAGTLYIEQRNDGTNWDVQSSFAYAAGELMGFSVEVVGNEARIRYTNGGVAQTTFRLYARARRI